MGNSPPRPFQPFSSQTSNYVGVTILSKNGFEIVGADAQSDVVRSIYTALSELTDKPEKHVIVSYIEKDNLVRIECKKVFSDSMFSSERSAMMQKLAWTLILLYLRKAGWEHALSSDLQTGSERKYADLQFFRKTNQPAPTDMICVAPSAADSLHILTPVRYGPEIERCVIDSVRKYWKQGAPFKSNKDTKDDELQKKGWQLTELKFPGGIWMSDSARKSFWSGDTEDAEKFANARYLLSDIVTNCGKDSGWRLYTTANIKSTTDWLFFCKFSENFGGNFSQIGGHDVFAGATAPPPPEYSGDSVLPDFWEEKFSEEHKRTYYVNHQTQQTQWERPEVNSVPSFAPPSYTSNINHFYSPFADTSAKTPPRTVSLVETNKLRVLGFDSGMFGHFRGAIQQSGLGIEKEDAQRYNGLANGVHFKFHGNPWGRDATDNSRLAILNILSCLASQGLELVTEMDTSRNHRDKSTFVIAPNHVETSQNNAGRRFLALSTEDNDKIKLIGSFSPDEINGLQTMFGASFFPVRNVSQGGFSYEFQLSASKEKKWTQQGIWHCSTWISHKSGFMINLLGVMEGQLGWKLMCKMDISTWVHTRTTGSGKNKKTHHYLKGTDTWIFSK